ncbi:LLM class flavin-dependent oxidoreductase [Pseudonocardia acaciae]|uniref:LLM class flavin-dependent oxidoreductase n=1 Tax=Pseudonocardia acaciae TaxID=551276 RepID=UPI000490C8EF|nr:LLM class flavin-dependent oxidoreductase [Pseudonocardia acaciae]
MSRPLHLALEIDGDGAHPAAWRRAAHPPAALLTPARVRAVGRIAENAGFTLVTLDDDIVAPGAQPNPVGRIGSVERAAFLAASTSVLGVAPVVSTTYAEPFHVSSQLASVDHVSNGRAGWVVGSSPGTDAARAWGRPPVEGERARAREARDSTRVVRELWDSWEDDAVIRDVATSRYLDRDRLHYIDFTGETFAVKGPAIVPRPPQGQLVVFAPVGLVSSPHTPAGLDERSAGGRLSPGAGRALPSDQVDVALVGRASPAPGSPLTFAEVELALDTPGGSAAQRVADLERHGPWPDRGRLRYTGGADGLVRLLTDLRARGLAGARLHPLVLDEDLEVLSRFVLPALGRARAVSRPLPGASLRTTLGLPRPANRYATAPGSAR